MTTLHITNGDTTARLIDESTIEGHVLPWRDPMHHGPFPAHLDLDALGERRAEYLAAKQLNLETVKRDFRDRNQQLRAAADYDDIILWFEHDLLDQLQLLEILNWFDDARFSLDTLSIICINQFSGVSNFRGLGQLSTQDLESLLPAKELVTFEQLRLAKALWSAFRSHDPRILEQQLKHDLSVLPFLKPALQRHLQEYPWTQDGLTRTERQILHLVSAGISSPTALFVKNMELEQALYIGDWHTYRIIARLSDHSHPLLECGDNERFFYPPEDDIPLQQFRQQSLSLSEAARLVLNAQQHAHAYIRRDEWLGGVHLSSTKPLWMWNNDTSTLQR